MMMIYIVGHTIGLQWVSHTIHMPIQYPIISLAKLIKLEGYNALTVYRMASGNKVHLTLKGSL